MTASGCIVHMLTWDYHRFTCKFNSEAGNDCATVAGSGCATVAGNGATVADSGCATVDDVLFAV